MRVFLDSDVVISSLISNKGAAYLILKKANIEKLISNLSVLELREVVDRLNLDKNMLNS